MEEFIELSSDANLKLQFIKQLPSKFWINVQNAYTTLARKALKKLLAFATTYLCETGSHTMCQKLSRLIEQGCRVGFGLLRVQRGGLLRFGVILRF